MGKVTAMSQRRDAMVMMSVQGVVIALLAVYGKYGDEADATRSPRNATSEDSVDKYYPRNTEKSVDRVTSRRGRRGKGAGQFRLTVSLLLVQDALLVAMVTAARYRPHADGSDARNSASPFRGGLDSNYNALYGYYSMFQDVHVMIYIGFGFLMTFLKKYCYSATGFTLLLGAMLVQWAVLCKGFFHLDPVDHKIHVGIESLLNADIAAAAVLISVGAVLGKTTPLQLLMMGMIEIVAFTSNEYIGVNIFKAVDAGGSMYVHVFGAYFGLAVSMMLQHGKVLAAESDGGETNEEASYSSDAFAMIGSIFLWLFWPSFNAGLCSGDERHRAVINTYLSLASCCTAAFATSALLGKDHKFNMVHVQNSTLAGGVAIGTVANMMVYPYGALLIGAAAGALSVAGYHYIQPLLLRSIKLHDTCGVHYLHGLPGVFSGLVGAVVAGAATESDYGYSLYRIFPARMPPDSTPEYSEYVSHLGAVEPGDGRSAVLQAAYQLVALGVSMLFALGSGAATGIIIRAGCLKSIPTRQLFDDALFWLVNEDENMVKLAPIFRLPEGHTTASSDTVVSVPVQTGLILKTQIVADLPQECYFDDELYWDVPEAGLTSEQNNSAPKDIMEMNDKLDTVSGSRELTCLDISLNQSSS